MAVDFHRDWQRCRGFYAKKSKKSWKYLSSKWTICTNATSTQSISLIADRQTTGQKIVVYRHVRGMSQRALALKLNVDPGTLGRWEEMKAYLSASSN